MADAKMANRWGANLKFYKYDPQGYYDDSTLLYQVDFANEVEHSLESGVTYATGGQAHSNMIGFKDSTNGTLTITTQIVTDTLRAIAAGMDIANYHEGDPVNYMNDEIAIIPQTYIITAETMYQDTKGKAHKRIMKYMKATVSPAADESFTGDGDPQELSIEFELGTNEDLAVQSSQTDPNTENSGSGDPDEGGNDGDGDDGDKVEASTSDELLEDIKAGETIVLNDTIEISAKELEDALKDVDGEVTIDLDGNELSLTGEKTLTVQSGTTLTIKGDGESAIVSDVQTDSKAVLKVTAGGTLNVENVKYDGAGRLFQVIGEDAELNITGCDLTTSGPYAVTIDNLPDEKPIVNITDSMITCTADNSVGVFCIEDADVYIKNSTITAHREGVFMKNGKAVIEDSTIAVVLTYNDSEGYCEDPTSWTAAGPGACGAVVCGTPYYSLQAYYWDSDVTLKNVTLSCTTNGSDTSDHCFALYAIGHLMTKQDGSYVETTVSADEATIADSIGKVYVAGSETYEDEFVNTPEGASVTIDF